MTRRTLWAGAGALAVLGVAVVLALRTGDDPVAASAKAPAVAAVASDAGPALARLGDQQVSVEELKALFAKLPAPAREELSGNRQALEGWIRSRLAEKALYQQAQAQGWSERPDVQAQTHAVVEQIVLRDYLNSVSQVPADYPNEAELQAAYENGKASLQLPTRYHLSQIFLAVPDEQSVARVRKQALALSKQAQAANADFAALARANSQDRESAQRGGDSGLQPLSQLLPQVRDAVPQLKEGAVSEPLQSAAGFHIVKLIEVQPPRVASLDEVRDSLRDLLRAQRQEQVARAYVDGMFNSATLSIDGAALNQVMDASR